MKICRLTGETFPALNQISSGLAPNYYYLCKHITEKGQPNTLIAGGYPAYLRSEKIENFNVIRVENNLLNKTLGNLPLNYQFLKIIKNIDFDILHVHNAFGILAQKYVREKLKKPVVLSWHACISWNYNEEFIPFGISPARNIVDRINSLRSINSFKLATKNADAIIGISRAACEDLKKFVNNKKVFCAYNGFSPELFNNKKVSNPYNSSIENNLLYVGSFIPRKGLIYLLKALRLVKKEVKNLRLTLIGTSNKAYIKYFDYLVNRYRLKDHILRIGSQPHVELSNYYNNADLFILPSLSEGFGKVIVEALACECPVIATNIEGIPEIINKQTGIIVEPREVNNLKEAIIWSLENKSASKKMAKRGGKEVIKKFTWEKTAKTYSKIYDTIMR